ncbi:MAG: hypothetical protein FWE48_02725, partial [Coriobacteriia bacterium]|nr:hypothetical protein [Coriobacteriia bacterium]
MKYNSCISHRLSSDGNSKSLCSHKGAGVIGLSRRVRRTSIASLMVVLLAVCSFSGVLGMAVETAYANPATAAEERERAAEARERAAAADERAEELQAEIRDL